MLIDTHTHLYLDDFDQDRKEMVQRALDSGVKKLFLPNIDKSTFPFLIKMCKDFPGICYPMAGLHPGSVRKNFQKELDYTKQQLNNKNLIAIGEIGVDLYWDKTFQKQQEKAFEIQVEWAIESNLPVVIHARDSFREIFSILDNIKSHELKGVFHSFTGGLEEVKKIRDYDFYFGINGIVSFKNSGIKDLLKMIPANRLILETDSPYLAPVPKRGKRNESSFLIYTNDFIADYLGIEPIKLQESTTKNALNLFKIG